MNLGTNMNTNDETGTVDPPSESPPKPKEQAKESGSPPKPPKKTARDLEDKPDEP